MHKWWKWRKESDNRWVYVPSLTDRNPFFVFVEDEDACPEDSETERVYRARLAREGLDSFSIGPWHPRSGPARTDARRFIGGHTSYERLLDLYAELVANHAREPDYVIPTRHYKKRGLDVESMMELGRMLRYGEKSEDLL